MVSLISDPQHDLPAGEEVQQVRPDRKRGQEELLGNGHQKQTAESEQDGCLDDGCRGQDEQREEDVAKADKVLEVIDLPLPCLQSFYALLHVERGLEGGDIVLRSCRFPTQPPALRYWVESRELEGWRPAERKLLLLRLGRGEDRFEVLHFGVDGQRGSPEELGALAIGEREKRVSRRFR